MFDAEGTSRTMPEPDETEPDEEQLTREAARIFLSLRKDPSNQKALEARETFLSRGPIQRDIYASMDRAAAFAERRIKSSKTKRYAFALLGVLLASLLLGFDAARVAWLADYRTRDAMQTVRLPTGDIVTLDVGSALTDETDVTKRHVSLLQGAAFFEVSQGSREFLVKSGPVTVTVTGTAFDVSTSDGATTVTVAEGSVRVSDGVGSWQLTAGQRLSLDGARRAEVLEIDESDAAGWRTDQLLTNGMRFGQVADILDRRIPGKVLVLSGSLADTRISGVVDVTDPIAALKTLAATRNARVIAAPYVTFVVP